MKHHLYLAPLLLIATLASCRPAETPAAKTASLNQEIQLAPKERVAYGERGLNVEFVGVLEDSRCPTDATCVWAGEVEVQLATRIDAAEAVMHEIKAGQPATVGAYRLAVVAVQPDRTSTRDISPEEYRVTVKVDRP